MPIINSLLSHTASKVLGPLAEVGQVLRSSEILVGHALENFDGCHFGMRDFDHRHRHIQIQR